MFSDDGETEGLDGPETGRNIWYFSIGINGIYV